MAESSKARLVVTDGPAAGKTIPVPAVGVIGRSEDREIPVEDTAISRDHARIEWGPRGYMLTDLESVNGTFLNDVRIKEPSLLRHGDVIRVGRSKLRFECPESVPAPKRDEKKEKITGELAVPKGLKSRPKKKLLMRSVIAVLGIIVLLLGFQALLKGGKKVGPPGGPGGTEEGGPNASEDNGPSSQPESPPDPDLDRLSRTVLTLAQAKDLLRVADDLFAQRDYRLSNGWSAIKRYDLVVKSCENSQDSQAKDLYIQALDRRQQATDWLSQEHDKRKFLAEHHMRTGDFIKANGANESIMQLIPDTEDRRYREAMIRRTRIRPYLR